MAVETLRGPRYARLWERARAHLERKDGEPVGSFSVPVASEEETAALNGLLGTARSAGRAGLNVDAARLETTLREGYGLGLAEFLELTGPKLRPAGRIREHERLVREEVLAPALDSPLRAQDWYRRWLEWLDRDPVGRGRITGLVKREDTLTLAQAVRTLEEVAAPGREPLLLQELAVRATGDTKALDEGAGTLPTLVLGALAERSGTGRPGGSEAKRALWEEHEVVRDDLASRVLVLGLAAAGEGLGRWLAEAAARRVPFQVTLHQLVTMPVTVDAPVVHVCENPAVLRLAAQRLGAGSAPLLCTEGWPSAAFHRLADAITAGGGRLFHHGDFDRAGLAITQRMIERHGARPWRMGAADYLAHEADQSHPLASVPAASPWDPGLVRAMAERGQAVFEESVVEALLDDLRRA